MDGEDLARFADAELTQLRHELDVHLTRFEDIQRAEAAWKRENSEQIKAMIAQMHENNVLMRDHIEQTAGVLKLYQDFQGAARLGASGQRFMLWLVKWPAIAAIVITAISFITKHFPPPLQ